MTAASRASDTGLRSPHFRDHHKLSCSKGSLEYRLTPWPPQWSTIFINGCTIVAKPPPETPLEEIKSVYLPS